MPQKLLTSSQTIVYSVVRKTSPKTCTVSKIASRHAPPQERVDALRSNHCELDKSTSSGSTEQGVEDACSITEYLSRRCLIAHVSVGLISNSRSFTSCNTTGSSSYMALASGSPGAFNTSSLVPAAHHSIFSPWQTPKRYR